MAENNEENAKIFGANSNFIKVLLVIFAALLIFAGPTYLVYILDNVIKIGYFASIASGFVVLIVGLALMGYLVRKKVIM